MNKVNYWRVATIALLVALGVAGYAIYVLRGRVEPSPASRGDSIARAKHDAPRSSRTIELTPSWPIVELPGPATPAKLEFKHDYKFARDWHTRHASYWLQALEPFRGKPDVRYLEIGLFEGASFFWMLETILTDPSARATGIDPFFREYSNKVNYGDTFHANLELSGEKSRAEIITGFSQVELRKLPLESFDIVYIDGSHMAVDVLEDAVLAWRLLKDGGVLIFDDYQLWLDRPVSQRPQLAIDIFYAFFGPRFDVIHNGYQVMLRKRPSR